MSENLEYSEPEVADANRQMTRFCRYKKTYYLAALLVCILIVITIIAIFSFTCPSKTRLTKAKVTAPTFSVQAAPSQLAGPGPQQAGENDFLQGLLAKLNTNS